MRSLRDTRKHNIHDHDAAHLHEDGHYSDSHGKDRPRELLPDPHDAFRSIDPEIVGIVVREMVPGSHQGSHLILERLHLICIKGLNSHPKVTLRLKELPICRQGDMKIIVVALAEGGADPLGDPDHPERLALDLNHPVDGVDAGEELVRDVPAEKA